MTHELATLLTNIQISETIWGWTIFGAAVGVAVSMAIMAGLMECTNESPVAVAIGLMLILGAITFLIISIHMECHYQIKESKITKPYINQAKYTVMKKQTSKDNKPLSAYILTQK